MDKTALQAYHNRTNANASRRRLERLIRQNFSPTAHYCVLRLNLRSFHPDRESLLWSFRNDIIRKLRYETPALRYVYSIDLRDPAQPAFHLLTNAREESIRAMYAAFWLSGDIAIQTLESAGIAALSRLMTTGIHGSQGSRIERMYVPSRGLRCDSTDKHPMHEIVQWRAPFDSMEQAM